MESFCLGKYFIMKFIELSKNRQQRIKIQNTANQ